MQLREIFFSDCIKAQNPVSSGTFLFLFSFTSSMAKSPVFSLSLLRWFLSPYLLEENHQQIMLMVCQIWSCEAICPSIPKFHLAKPTQFLPHPSAPKPSNNNNNNTTSWQDEHKSVSMCAASNLRPNLFFTSFFERSKTDFEENIMAGLFLFFPLLNMAVELVVGMWYQFNSESCFSFSWKPHRKFFEKLQNSFTVKPGDRENLFTPFTGKSCCVQLKQV